MAGLSHNEQEEPMADAILYQTPSAGIARIILNRADTRNAQDTAFLYALNKAFDRAAQDGEVKVIVHRRRDQCRGGPSGGPGQSRGAARRARDVRPGDGRTDRPEAPVRLEAREAGGEI
jgi:enoyl-CoA hydratase/carnithine racemase